MGKATLYAQFLGLNALCAEKPVRLLKSSAAVVQGRAREALRKLLESLGGFALDCGLSVSEVNLLLRVGTIRSAAKRQRDIGGRVNISGIAAMTGISRAEVSRILAGSSVSSRQAKERYLNPTNKVLKGWHSDRKFLSASRQPMELEIFGRGLTFESLVNQYGRGIPVRAIFDELIRIGAVEVTDAQRIYPLTSVAVDRRITSQMIKDLDGGATDLFSAISRAAVVRGEKGGEEEKKPTDRRRNFRRVG